MAATIRDRLEEDVTTKRSRKHLKAALVNKLEGCSDTVNMAVTIPHEDAVISVSDDKSIRLWIKRESGQYWPSICHVMESACSALDYHGTSRRLFVGLASGTISEFQVTEDFNRLHHKRNYLAHMNRVTRINFSLENEWLLSTGRDKYLQWHDCTTGKRLGGYQTEAWCTSLQFDAESKHVFVGDYGAHISIIKLENNSPSLVTTLNGHSGSVRALAWDPDKRLLFSGSFDESIIIWDIGGNQGTAFELHGHLSKVQDLCYAPHAKKLISCSEDGIVRIWDMNVKRQETPEWSQSDVCERCGGPFFWNFKAMWNQRAVGVRQHHCRKCGRAVCNDCGGKESSYPIMGYENSVRMCVECHESITDDERLPLADLHDAKHTTRSMHLDLTKGRLLTCGGDRIVKIWDIKAILLS
ncbi:PREDICTED: WD repeat and FYVE domain-containing protein 2-like isoform X2 [Acropora digitifera]|uniref:WD repeat and FYVE domain-containing protein 2-like isoform X2 n=1 Tax=Acropora digitifera TaxID=70779 RepID=UPI00077A5506|nr:PREDICTED: WD repeat and FYVE domain-containing protein 2-like isoform X2 [Acropora digitifera]